MKTMTTCSTACERLVGKADPRRPVRSSNSAPLFFGEFTCLLTGHAFKTSAPDGLNGVAGSPSTSPVTRPLGSRVTGGWPFSVASRAGQPQVVGNQGLLRLPRQCDPLGGSLCRKPRHHLCFPICARSCAWPARLVVRGTWRACSEEHRAASRGVCAEARRRREPTRMPGTAALRLSHDPWAI